jgi:predicted nucleotidyltransferase
MAFDLLVKDVSSTIHKLYGDRLLKIILYGSYARGEQTPESDVDLMVVLNDSPIAAGKEIRYMNGSLFTIALLHNTSISVHPVSSERYQNSKSFFLNRVRKEGKEI